MASLFSQSSYRHPEAKSGPRAAAEEIVPLPLLPRLWGGGKLLKQIEARRNEVERIIEAHCFDRRLAERALEALSAEVQRLAIGGRSVPPDMLDVIAVLQKTLEIK